MAWGHHNIQYHDDILSGAGAWSPPTSRANFCEEDYVVTFYLAEFINSVSNIAYVYYALKSMYGRGSRGILSPQCDFMNASLFVLGIGSFLFHASLRQALEFVDELSMLLLCWSMLHVVLTIRQSRSTVLLTTVALNVIFVGFGAFYVSQPKTIYQVIAFVSGILVICLRTLYLCHRAQPAFPKDKVNAWRSRSLRAVGIALFGYVLWNIDLSFCAQLRQVKAQAGLPLAWFLELHGWWHVFTAIGAARFMDVARELRDEARVEQAKNGGTKRS